MRLLSKWITKARLRYRNDFCVAFYLSPFYEQNISAILNHMIIYSLQPICPDFFFLSELHRV
jgi:hypothetical protein